MKFDEYVSYLKESNDLENTVHKAFPIRIEKDTFHCSGKASLNSDPNYSTTKSITVDINLALTNLGKGKLLSYPDIIQNPTPVQLREYGKALDIMNKEIARVTELYIASLEEAFGKHGFIFASKSELTRIKNTSPTEETTEVENTEN